MLKWILISTFLMHFSSHLVAKENKTTPVKIPFIPLQYSGGIKEFNSPKLILTPFAQFIEYKVKKETFSQDCEIVNKTGDSHWLCKSICSGGDLKISFDEKIGYDIIKIAPFKIQPSHCDENSSPKAPWISSKKELIFKIKKLGKK